jgi:hypothetical protein
MRSTSPRYVYQTLLLLHRLRDAQADADVRSAMYYSVRPALAAAMPTIFVERPLT